MSGVVSDVRAAAVVLFVLIAIASAAWTLPATWDELRAQHSLYAPLTRRNPNVVPIYTGFLPADAQTFFRSRLQRGDPYFVHVGPGPEFGTVDRVTAVGMFARYALLPAVRVDDPAHANVILGVGADPRTLGLPFTVVAEREGRYFVARRHA